MKFAVIFSNQGGELDKRVVDQEQDTKRALLEMIEGADFLSPGDTFRIVEVEG